MTEHESAWSLQCQRCGKFIGPREHLGLGRVDGEDVAQHYDALSRHWCGPVVRVELRSETDA